VQIPDDEQFETYLKRFHPIAPEPLPTLKVSRVSRYSLRLGAWLAAVAAILIVGTRILHVHDGRVVGVPNAVRDGASVERLAPFEPLTMRSANAWLATAPSFKSAVDNLAFRSQGNPIQKGKQSAVALLSKEKIKL